MAHNFKSVIAIGALSIALAGCGAVGGGGSGAWQTQYQDLIDPEVSKTWRVVSIDVSVPENLTVSEANTYAPDADIVWRGEPVGDRYLQVDRIITEAAKAAASALKGSTKVHLSIEVQTFHALTEITRYSVQNAGVHNISFFAQVFDANTGEPLTVIDDIDADLVAYTGNTAILAEARGETQRVRIVNHVTKVISGWLGAGEDVRGRFTRSGR